MKKKTIALTLAAVTFLATPVWASGHYEKNDVQTDQTSFINSLAYIPPVSYEESASFIENNYNAKARVASDWIYETRNVRNREIRDQRVHTHIVERVAVGRRGLGRTPQARGVELTNPDPTNPFR